MFDSRIRMLADSDRGRQFSAIADRRIRREAATSLRVTESPRDCEINASSLRPVMWENGRNPPGPHASGRT